MYGFLTYTAVYGAVIRHKPPVSERRSGKHKESVVQTAIYVIKL